MQHGSIVYITLTHLEHTLIIDLAEDGAIDLVGFQCSPVEDREAELGFYGFLNAYGYRIKRTSGSDITFTKV